MIIIGLNSQYDGAMKVIAGGSAALIVDGVIKTAIAEERISRVKYQGGYAASLKTLLTTNDLDIGDVDYFYISFYGNPLIPSKQVVDCHLADLGLEATPEKLVVIPSHHLSHAYLSYFLSPFDRAIIVVSDNEGSQIYPENQLAKESRTDYCERNSYYWAEGNCVTLIDRDFENPGQLGFGKAYNKFNRFIGFGGYHNAGKTMGLSSYGRPRAKYRDVDIWEINEDGSLQSKMIDNYHPINDVVQFFAKCGIEVSHLNFDKAYLSEESKDLAFYIQQQLNKWMEKKVKLLMNRTGISNVCLSGGVALNGVTNTHIEKTLTNSVFVPPFPSDQGQSLGNAIYGHIHQTEKSHNALIPRFVFSNFTYLGPEYSSAEVSRALTTLERDITLKILSPKDIRNYVARLLHSGKIIGLFQGRSEYGARALGNRSIISAPTSTKLRDRVNTLKRRELFRPLAPAVLDEQLHCYFDSPRSYLWDHMLGVATVREEVRKLIPGVVHVDGTARLQAVKKSANVGLYELISAYHNISGIPMVINTSFNLAGEPIVETPGDAIKTFQTMKLDGLVLENTLIVRTTMSDIDQG